MMKQNNFEPITVYYKPIYIFDGYYDNREDIYGPVFGDEDDYKDALYYTIYKWEGCTKVNKKEMSSFEKDKIIIRNKRYVPIEEAKKICREEVDDKNNKSEEDMIRRIIERIDEYNYTHSQEYKENQLLDRVTKLYNKVKGNLVKEEKLYSGKFLQIIRESYQLQNGKLVAKEKVIKNNGKNAVIVIPKVASRNIYSDYIITFQNRINNEIVAEFPSGYIKENETVLDAAKRELIEETGYTSRDMEILDEVYTSPGIDNSKTYIVLANECFKVKEPSNKGTEYVCFDIFTRTELDYFVYNNIMSGAINRLAYQELTSENQRRRRNKPKL